MKITKSQLKRIIKEQLKEYAMEPPMGEEPADLASEVQRLYDEWQPQTPEGQKYKADLGAVLGAPTEEPSSQSSSWLDAPPTMPPPQKPFSITDRGETPTLQEQIKKILSEA